MVPEGRKGKASSITQVVKPKTTFRKKIGKMKEEEEQEISRTHQNIFSLVEGSWKSLEINRTMRDILDGDVTLKWEIETS